MIDLCVGAMARAIVASAVVVAKVVAMIANMQVDG